MIGKRCYSRKMSLRLRFDPSLLLQEKVKKKKESFVGGKGMNGYDRPGCL